MGGKTHPRILPRQCHRPMMLRRVGNLVIIIRRRWIRAVLCTLVTVVARCRQRLTLRQLMRDIQRDISTQHTHFAHVHAVPHKHVVGNRHNHVLHPIVITVERGLHTGLPKLALPRQPHIQLLSPFGFQFLRAVMEEVVLVKRWGTEDFLIGGSHVQMGQHPVGKAERGRQAMRVISRTTLLGTVQVERMEQTPHHGQTIRTILRRRRLQECVAIRMLIHRERAVQIVMGIVRRIVKSPMLCGHIEQASRRIVFALPVICILQHARHHPIVV